MVIINYDFDCFKFHALYTYKKLTVQKNKSDCDLVHKTAVCIINFL